jgi:hypothetical protein
MQQLGKGWHGVKVQSICRNRNREEVKGEVPRDYDGEGGKRSKCQAGVVSDRGSIYLMYIRSELGESVKLVPPLQRR